MKIDCRFSNGLLVTNLYMFSWVMDLVNENTNIGMLIDFDKSWGRSNFDCIYNWVMMAIYELFWGLCKRWLSDGKLG